MAVGCAHVTEQPPEGVGDELVSAALTAQQHGRCNKYVKAKSISVSESDMILLASWKYT